MGHITYYIYVAARRGLDGHAVVPMSGIYLLCHGADGGDVLRLFCFDKEAVAWSGAHVHSSKPVVPVRTNHGT